MKILEIIGNLGQGGAERFVVDLCNVLCKEHDVTLMVYSPFEKPKNRFYLPLLDKSIKLIYIADDKYIYFKLYSFIKSMKPDIVHTHLGRTLRFPFFSYFLYRKAKYIHTIHSDAKAEAGGAVDQFVHKLIFKLRLSNPITISEESHRSFVEYYNRDAFLINNGRPAYIEDKEAIVKAKKEIYDIKQHKDATTILNVARISKPKNQKILVEAIDELNKEGERIELFIVGVEGKLKFCEINKNNSPYTHYLGPKNNPRDYMKACDAFCLSSSYEGMPITLIECFSTGSIPVCTPVGGIKSSIKDGVNGLLAEGIGYEELKKVLKRFISLSTEEKTNISQASRDTFANFDMKICSKKYINYMQNLLK